MSRTAGIAMVIAAITITILTACFAPMMMRAPVCDRTLPHEYRCPSGKKIYARCPMTQRQIDRVCQGVKRFG